MRCYVCNKEIVDNPTKADECKAHGEHIIHNGIRGKLISKTILCEKCGGAYSKEDSAFCKIFDPFMAALNDRLIPADHGKDTEKVLKGSLFDTPTANPEDPSRSVTIKKGTVAPIEPYYEIDGGKITLYAEKHRINQYEQVVSKQLAKEGKDITNYAVEKVTDIHDKGYLAYYFSKDNATFNQDFKNGMVKIATEFALDCGIPREQLTSVITINPDGTACIDNTNTKVIPFIPTTVFDCLFEDYRYALEEGYPSHTLKLFSTKYDNGTAVLYCYIDLFSTFQYYVVLNEDYKGEEVSKMYAQRLIPRTKEKPDLTQCDPSDLDIVIREYDIDMSQCTATSYEGQLDYVKDCLRKYPLQTYDLQKALNRASDKINMLVTAYFSRLLPFAGKGASQIFAKAAGFDTIPPSVEAILESFTEKVGVSDIMLLSQAFSASVEGQYYRKFGFEVVDGDVMNYSQPDESMKVFDKSRAAAQEYTNAKFSHLSCLCYNPELIEQ